MPPTRQQYDEYAAKQQALQQRNRALDLAVLHSAAVKSEQLTDHPGWDLFLEQLQGRVEQAQAECAAWSERLHTPLGDTDLHIAQCNWHLWKSRVDTLHEVMELPKLVLETAKRELTPQGVASGQP